jgi:hypothetical protein
MHQAQDERLKVRERFSIAAGCKTEESKAEEKKKAKRNKKKKKAKPRPFDSACVY